MAIDFSHPAIADNHSTAFVPAILANQIALAQWLDSVQTAVSGAPATYAKRYNRATSSLEEFNGSAWAPATLQGLLYSAGNWGLGAAPGAFKLDITGTLRASGLITASGGISGALAGNASTATALATARAINGINFDGSANITIPADAGTLTGGALPAGVTASSLTSLGTLSALNIATGALSATATAVNQSYSFNCTAAGNQGSITFQPGNAAFGAPAVDIQNSAAGVTARFIIHARANQVFFLGVGAAHDYVFAVNGGAELMRLTAAGNLYGTAGSTAMTDGFVHIPKGAGAPSGAPTTFAARAPLYYDGTNNRLYAYNGAWKSVLLT